VEIQRVNHLMSFGVSKPILPSSVVGDHAGIGGRFTPERWPMTVYLRMEARGYRWFIALGE
ncbi:MAG TPA: hypothetical protein VHZ28_10015, partial [Terracidiphilus sp.]|nr:hypothetical protein [Terracidiphilus sp.]